MGWLIYLSWGCIYRHAIRCRRNGGYPNGRLGRMISDSLVGPIRIFLAGTWQMKRLMRNG